MSPCCCEHIHYIFFFSTVLFRQFWALVFNTNNMAQLTKCGNKSLTNNGDLTLGAAVKRKWERLKRVTKDTWPRWPITVCGCFQWHWVTPQHNSVSFTSLCASILYASVNTRRGLTRKRARSRGEGEAEYFPFLICIRFRGDRQVGDQSRW